jgi:hypothetical protein
MLMHRIWELGQALNLPLPRRFFPPIFGLDSHLLVKTKNSQCGMICGLIVPAPVYTGFDKYCTSND